MEKERFGHLSKLAMMGVLLLFVACSDNVTEEMTVNETVIGPKTMVKDDLKDQMNARLAQSLASSLVHIEVRNFLKEKAVEQFDGDYNFLIETSKNEQITITSNGRTTTLTFGQFLSGASSNYSARGSTSTSFLDSLNERYPLLQVAIPELEVGDAETWDTGSSPPLVAFVPSDYDESNKSAIITAYDLEGNQYGLSATEEPDQLVVVISENESLIALAKPESTPNGSANAYPILDGSLIMIDPYHENETHLHYFRYDVYPILDGGTGFYTDDTDDGPGGGGGGSTTCDRERKNGRDNLRKARFTSKSAIRDVEPWVFGKPEMYVLITTANPTNDPTVFTQRKWVGKEGWYHRSGLFRRLVIDTKWINIPIYTWDDDVYGDRMVYTWIEEDWTPFKIDFDVQVSSTFNVLNSQVANITVTGTGTVRIFSGDDVSGDATVEYCGNTDGDGTRHVAGGVEFYVNQE